MLFETGEIRVFSNFKPDTSMRQFIYGSRIVRDKDDCQPQRGWSWRASTGEPQLDILDGSRAPAEQSCPKPDTKQSTLLQVVICDVKYERLSKPNLMEFLQSTLHQDW